MMTPEEEAEIRDLGLSDPEQVIRIICLWNTGYSTNHIVEELGLADAGAVLKPMASVRTRTSVVMRKIGKGSRSGAPEHPSWWTPARTALGKSLWEAGEIRNKMIADRLHTCEAAITAKAAEDGWTRVAMSASKKRGKQGIRPADRIVSNITSVGKGVVFEALPGTTPIPFWKVALKGECNFILQDIVGSMSDALCCAAETNPGERYCPIHMARCASPLASGKPRTGNELARALRRFA